MIFVFSATGNCRKERKQTFHDEKEITAFFLEFLTDKLFEPNRVWDEVMAVRELRKKLFRI